MKWKNLFVRDGNLTDGFEWLLVLCGLAIALTGFRWAETYFLKLASLAIGFPIAAIGAYSAKAVGLGLKPFDTAPWRRARKTYEDSPDT